MKFILLLCPLNCCFCESVPWQRHDSVNEVKYSTKAFLISIVLFYISLDISIYQQQILKFSIQKLFFIFFFFKIFKTNVVSFAAQISRWSSQKLNNFFGSKRGFPMDDHKPLGDVWAAVAGRCIWKSRSTRRFDFKAKIHNQNGFIASKTQGFPCPPSNLFKHERARVQWSYWDFPRFVHWKDITKTLQLNFKIEDYTKSRHFPVYV